MTLIGKYSFSVYLLHVPVLYAFEQLGLFTLLPYPVAVGAMLVTVVIVPGLSFHLLENLMRIATRRWTLKLFRVGEERRAKPVQATA